MHPHRSNALHGAAAVLTVTLRRGVAVSLSWSWSHQPQGRACAAAPALRDTFIRTPDNIFESRVVLYDLLHTIAERRSCR